jgi:uncharacterized protein (TIGR02466 family)
MQKQIAEAYPTPIGKFHILADEAGPVNAALREEVLRREQSEPTQQYSNVGGWHSKHDLFNWSLPAVETLRGWVTEAVQHMVASTAHGKAVRGSIQAVAWANVMRHGCFHRIHNHPASAWSGVYYVDPGTPAANHSHSGVFEIMDPRPHTEMVPTPGSPFGQRAIFRPEPGLMLVFPSWLYHFVNPYYGTGARISIAFNIAWRDAGA